MSAEPAPPAGGLRLFTGEPQHEAFCRLKDLLPSVRMARSQAPHPFPEGPRIDLPATFEFDGATRSVEDALAGTDTAALLVLKDGVVRFERYALTGGRDVQWISWSVAKSFVSTLVGIAVDEGLIGGIDQPISDYVPVEAGSAYDGVSIRHVLQMSSGARWNEDYNDPGSDVHRLAAAMTGATTLDAFVATMAPESPPGSVCRYNSGDTQALGALLVRATGRSLADYMHEKLCEPLGFEADSYWLTDAAGMEMAFAGLNLTARDFARLGELYRNGGRWGGRRIVPEAWVRASVRADAPHLQPGRPILADHPLDLGYGYQWWLPNGDRGAFSAIGVYNQLVFVDPPSGAVIVKLSASRTYGTSMEERTNRDLENVALLQAIGASLDDG
ncbi:MAG: serine hydrolase [Phenylobacterium sp.]|uniref:serine hydrolase domain-containing protein n=1 Tax=Phenylobacterium sp. TaxID=1871053 RepID=UPI0025EC2A10|nr:serine hydrolase domain-containing protein [Phenylobacterium sp.]MBI1199071.1 serine hydrolase [Phenylobacterium sp.]